MIRSMTGFGRGEAAATAGGGWAVECAAVNRKHLEVVVSLPRELPAAVLEPELRQRVQARVARGRVQVQVRSAAAGEVTAGARLDATLAAAYLEQARALGKTLGVGGELTLADLLRLPGVAQSGGMEENGSGEDFDPAPVWQALDAALTAMIAMREAEGAHLLADVTARLDRIETLLGEINALAPQVVEKQRGALQQRLREAGLDLPLDDERLVKEVALFADRCDISEEIARAGSHLQQFRQSLAGGGAVGRSLDFLTQEFFREFNTMGAKANHAPLAHLVVEAKTELEKIREQTQNVE